MRLLKDKLFELRAAMNNILEKALEAKRALTITDYKKINERYYQYINVVMFFMLVFQNLQEIFNNIYFERIVLALGLVDIVLSCFILSNYLRMRGVLKRKSIHDAGKYLEGVKRLEEYILETHNNFVYQNILPFILLINENMIDFNLTRFADADYSKTILTIKLIMIIVCFFSILISEVIKRYSNIRKAGVLVILFLDMNFYWFIAFLILGAKYQRISYHIYGISILVLMLLYNYSYRPFKIVMRIICGILLPLGLFVAVTDGIISQIKPYQFEEYTGTWIYEENTGRLQLYCEITKEGEGNKLLIYQLKTDYEDNLLDYDLREYEIESFEMNKVLGQWYDYQGMISIDVFEMNKILRTWYEHQGVESRDIKELEDNAIPIQISFLSENIIHESQGRTIEPFLYQDGEIKKKGLQYMDEMVEGEIQYGVIILGEELWLYGSIPFTEIKSIPQEVLELLPMQ